ncbi:RCC1 domain-containing protein [Chengkuizengella marina]|uniref:SLH domain-containing protein n=1 Tax=Chengkuizengella marina TaxID=2507566 RepID=A0A6N9Q225_9BACL|nr:S-layer homology domain-containing protein [Chengkuizengella marina]NBI28384.1 hypothetical protein [Chengkuizengella marina]
MLRYRTIQRMMSWVLIFTMLFSSFNVIAATSDGTEDLITEDTTQTSLGQNHTVALSSNGTVYTWGKNNFGQLGNGTDDGKNVPVPLDDFANDGEDIIQVSAGSSYTVALSSDGTVYTWGKNNFGQLGNGTDDDKNVPVPLDDFANDGEDIIQVSAGSSYTVALSSDGTVYTWGKNNFGQLGDGTDDDKNVPVPLDDFANDGDDIIQVSAGGYHTVALSSDGTVYTWGMNIFGQLGDGTDDDKNVPVLLDDFANDGEDIIQVSAGSSYTVALSSDGTVYTWGSNNDGQLGDGTAINKNEPVEVNFDAEAFIDQVSAGSFHMTALTSKGKVYTWGWNSYGQLGDGTAINKNEPVEVNFDAGVTIKQVSAGVAHTAAISSDGTLYIWGKNDFGQLGLGESANGKELTPKKVSSLDHTPPSVEVEMINADNSTYEDDKWTNQYVHVSLTSDESEVSLEWQHEDDGWQDYVEPLEISKEGTHNYSFKATDVAGNVREETRTIKIDKTASELTITMKQADGSNYEDNTWTNQNVNLSLSSNEGAEISYLHEHEPDVWQSYREGDIIRIEKDETHTGSHNYTFKATDKAGNVTEETRTIKIDKVEPELTITMIKEDETIYKDDTWTNQNVTLSVSSNDDLAKLEWQHEEDGWQDYIDIIKIEKDETHKGTHNYSFKAIDVAGNETREVRTIKIDKTTSKKKERTSNPTSNPGTSNDQDTVEETKDETLEEITVEEKTTEQKFEELKTLSIFSGYTDGLPHLEDHMTREQAAKIIVLLFGLDLSHSFEEAHFTDVDKELLSYKYIEVAYKAGIINGIGNDQFNPNRNVTSEQFIKMLVAGYAYVKGVEIDQTREIDSKDVSGWAEKYVAAALHWGLVEQQENYRLPAIRELLVEGAYTTYEALERE